MTLVRNGRTSVQPGVTRPFAPPPPPPRSLVSRSVGEVKTLLSALVAVTLRVTTPLAAATIAVVALVAAFSALTSSSPSPSSASAALLGVQLAGNARSSNLRRSAASDSSNVGGDGDGGGDDGGDKASPDTLKNFYSFTAKDINGKTVHLSKYKGKVCLVVNVASECGYTHRNYEALVQMQRNFGSKKFAVLAFPCNQFGEQEPGDDWEIESFAEKLYKINFPLFSKINVKGPNAANCWKYLTKSSGKEPNWNFWKYLIDTNGVVTKVWGQKTSFSEIYRIAQDVIEGKYKQKHIVHTDL